MNHIWIDWLKLLRFLRQRRWLGAMSIKAFPILRKQANKQTKKGLFFFPICKMVGVILTFKCCAKPKKMHNKKHYSPKNINKSLMWLKILQDPVQHQWKLWKTPLWEWKTRMNYAYLVYIVPNIYQIECMCVQKKNTLPRELWGCCLHRAPGKAQ